MRCTDCKEDKAASEFNKNRSTKSGYQWICRKCQKVRHLDYAARNPRQFRAGYYRRKYQMTEQDVHSMLQAQDNKCLICTNQLALEPGNGLRKKQYQYDIDHDHRTGKVRGILCHNCNVGLGRFKDDPNLLTRAAEYLHGRT